jgi:hypothetical protein
MYYSLGNKFCIYFDSVFEKKFGCMDFDVIAKKTNKKFYELASSKLYVSYKKEQMTNGLINSGQYYYNDCTFVDSKLGVTIKKKANIEFAVFASQECPEWITLMCEVMMLTAGLTWVHAAGLEKDGKALFLPARGGVGKTATVVNMVRMHGWRLLGDDLLILDESNESILPFLKRFVIYGYHHDLFPEQFKKNGPVKNQALMHMMTKMIPIAKRILRYIPGALSYVRKHNPQQVRVLPRDIFKSNQLSTGANNITHTIWLERIEAGKLEYIKCSQSQIASRCAAVTISEMTYGEMNLNLPFLIMCECGMLDYDSFYKKIYNILMKCIGNECYILNIPKNIEVNELAEIVYRHSDI